MPEFSNSFTLAAYLCFTNRAVNHFVVTSVFGASCVNLIFSDRRRFFMPFRGNYRLFDENFVANRAMFTLCQPRFRTGRFFRRVDYSRMPFRRNFRLRDENFVTNRTMFTLGQPRFRASRFFSRVDYFRMPRRGNFILFNENLVANRTMFTLGQTGFRASRFFRRVDYFSMSSR